MSHIHLPDGILPLWLWAAGYALVAFIISLVWRKGRQTAEPRDFALLGVLSAIMILVMMIEIPPLSFHFNLSVVTGIILGPRLSLIAALIVNVILALIGHGGITVVGWNTLVLSAEMILGYYSFRLFSRIGLSVSRAGFFATVIGLAAGTFLAYDVITAASPWINRVLSSPSSRLGEALPTAAVSAHLDLERLALIMFGVGAVGWVLEGILSAVILSYISRVYPELVRSGETE